jgi:hypothetical protein
VCNVAATATTNAANNDVHSEGMVDIHHNAEVGDGDADSESDEMDQDAGPSPLHGEDSNSDGDK